MCISYGIIEGLTRISRILFRCIPPSIALSLFLASRRSHRFTQILSLQATVLYTSTLTVKQICDNLCNLWENSTFLILLSRSLSRTFRSSPYSHRPSGRDRRDRTCDTPLPCCQDSPLSASPDL